jgi:hypothetical protein
MPDSDHKIIAYNEGKHALMIGHGKPVVPGEQFEKRLKFYTVEEVYAHVNNGTIWTASLKETGKGRAL